MAALLLILPLDHESMLYLTLFLVLIFSGVGLPVPEEVTLLLGGYLAYLEFIDFWPTVYVLILGIVIADAMGYFFGRFAGAYAEEKISKWGSAAKFLEKARFYFEKHGEKMVLFTRPLLGIRVAVPILAGHFRMNFLKFLIFDAVGAIPWTLFLVFASYYFGLGLDFLVEVREIKYIIFIILVMAIIAYEWLKFRKNKIVQ